VHVGRQSSSAQPEKLPCKPRASFSVWLAVLETGVRSSHRHQMSTPAFALRQKFLGVRRQKVRSPSFFMSYSICHDVVTSQQEKKSTHVFVLNSWCKMM
jgi:hypothetical protein